MSDISNRIALLLFKAGHPNTPENEAKASAMAAAKLFYKHKDELLESSSVVEESRSYPINADDDIPDISSVEQGGLEQELFNMIISRHVGKCVYCDKPYNTGEIVAWVQGKGTTHYRCRRYWTEKKKG